MHPLLKLRQFCAFAAVPLRQPISPMSSVAGLTPMSNKHQIRGVVFDMDGTLTIPCIDFAKMYAECGVPKVPGADVLKHIASLNDEGERQRCLKVIEDHEERARQQVEMMSGCAELLHWLDKRQIRRGLITRNVKASIMHFNSRCLQPHGLASFDPALSRECISPVKPHPAALHYIADQWNVSPSSLLMVGDSAADDVVIGNRAGTLTALLHYPQAKGGGLTLDQLTEEQKPTHIVSSLKELQELLQNNYTFLR
jgi:phosphoglycolate phosphatase-like HAD superfamily hydrolase